MKTLFKGAAGVIKGALASAFAPLLAIFAVGAAFTAIKNTLTGSLAAFRDYSDSVTTLQAALRSVGETDIEDATAAVKKLGDQLRLSLGIKGADTARSFADFLTRGFDQRQATQLTILAANYAKKTGKPLAEVTRAIADAANGSAEAIKTLGVQVSVTGNRVRDGEAAVLALKNAYGDIGADLANPSERLAASMNELAVTLGSKISPILEPIIQGVSDFVAGLTRSEEGRILLEGIANTLSNVVDWIMRGIRATSNFVTMLKSGMSVVNNLIDLVVARAKEAIAELIRELPGGDKIAERLGLDPEKLREAGNAARAQMNASLNEFSRAQDDLFNDRADSGFAGMFEKIREAGKQAREEAAKELSQEIASTKNETFAGRAAQETEARKAAEARAKAVEKNNKRVAGIAGDVGDGQQVSVRIMSTRPDRFRKARAR